MPTATATPDVFADFRNFAWHVWKHLNLPDPTDVQYDIAAYLQHGPKRSVIEAFRGVGKSWLTAAFCLWLLLRDPQIKILVVSASKDRADAFSTFLLQLINELPVLQHLAPRGDQRSSKVAFDVGPSRPAQAPSVRSVGITGQLTGGRANIIVADDIEVPNNSATQGMREKLAEAVKEFDAVLSPGGRIVYLGTPQCEASLYNALPERGYQVRVWPALVPTPKQVDNYGPTLAPYVIERVARGAVPGTSLDPKRFTDTDLGERATSYGRAGFALQFMLDTRLSDTERYPLRLSDLMVADLDPDLVPAKFMWASAPEQAIPDLPSVGLAGDRFYRPMWHDRDTMVPFQGTVMRIDPSGKGKDETSYAIVRAAHGYLFLVASGGFLSGYAPETLTSLAELAKAHKVNKVLIEANYGGGMFTELIKPVFRSVHPCGVEEDTVKGQKERRIIDTLEPVMASHRLIVDPAVIKADWDSVSHYSLERQHHYRLFHQMTRITSARGALGQDDRLDALAGAVAYWTEAMAKDASKERDKTIDRLREQELTRFINNATGRKGRGGKSWVRL